MMASLVWSVYGFELDRSSLPPDQTKRAAHCIRTFVASGGLNRRRHEHLASQAHVDLTCVLHAPGAPFAHANRLIEDDAPPRVVRHEVTVRHDELGGRHGARTAGRADNPYRLLG
jgi:hypothetical protein